MRWVVVILLAVMLAGCHEQDDTTLQDVDDNCPEPPDECYAWLKKYAAEHGITLDEANAGEVTAEALMHATNTGSSEGTVVVEVHAAAGATGNYTVTMAYATGVTWGTDSKSGTFTGAGPWYLSFPFTSLDDRQDLTLSYTLTHTSTQGSSSDGAMVANIYA